MSDASVREAARKDATSAGPELDVGALVALLFFVSGAASLLLEVAALRAFLELFGSTAASLGAVGGAFLGCLALGAFVVGSRSDRSPRPLRRYALLEGVACVGGLLALFLLPQLDGLATAIAEAESRGESRLFARLLACAALLVVPVGALGATLPLLARVRESGRSRGAAAGGLQAASTLGAMAGALLGAVFLLGAIGTRGTWALAAGLNGLVALAALALARTEPAVAGAPAQARESEPNPASESGSIPVPALAIASFVAGFSVLAFEVLLFRGLGQVIRGSQDALGALLAAFLGASALGTAIGVRFARDRERARGGFALGQALSIVTPLLALWWLRRMSMAGELDWLRFGLSSTTWSGRLTQELLGALLVAGPVALATAIAFPCACELGRDARFGRLVAWLSGSWTLGAAIAGIVTPKLLGHPAFGLRNGLLFASGLPLVALLVVALGDRGLRSLITRRRVAWSLGTVGAAGALLFVPIGGASTASDPLRFFRRVAGDAPAILRDYREDPIANVAVVERLNGERLLAVNDQLSLGGTGTNGVEIMQGVLPALLHPAPKRALALGVGAGVTARALRQMGCEQVDAVELIPAVLDLLPWFAQDNGDLARDPRVRLHVEDARAFVRAAPAESYDLILGELFFPWEAEAGLLYTREHFERVKRLLAPGGIFCQWLPGHQLRWEELGVVGRTFAEVFGSATVWIARPEFRYPVLGLVAGTERLELDVPRLAERLAQHPAQELLKRLRVADVKDFLALYLASDWLFKDHFDDDSINTADRAIVEFRTSRRVETDEVVALLNRRRLFEVHEDVVFRMTQGSLDKKALAQLKHELSARAQATWQLFDAQTNLLLAAANRSLPPDARRNAPEELEARAFQLIGGVLRERPDDVAANEIMLSLLGEQLLMGAHARVVEGITSLEEDPAIGTRPRLRYLRGLAFLRAVSDPDPKQAALYTRPLDFAIKDFRKAIELDPAFVEAQVYLGVALFLTGTTESRAESRAVLQTARDKIVAPGRPGGHGLPSYAEAVLAFLLGQKEEAQQWLARPESQPWAAKLAAEMARPAP